MKSRQYITLYLFEKSDSAAILVFFALYFPLPNNFCPMGKLELQDEGL